MHVHKIQGHQEQCVFSIISGLGKPSLFIVLGTEANLEKLRQQAGWWAILDPKAGIADY